MTKEFEPTDEMVTAATLVFQGMALVGTVKPTVRCPEIWHRTKRRNLTVTADSPIWEYILEY